MLPHRRPKSAISKLLTRKPGSEEAALALQMAECLKLYATGMTIRAIAETLRPKRGVVFWHRVIVEAMAAIPREEVEKLREIEVAKLDEAESNVLRLREQFHPLFSGGSVCIVPDLDEHGEPTMVEEIDRYGNVRRDTNGRAFMVAKMRMVEDMGAVLECEQMLLRIRQRRAEMLGLDVTPKSPFFGKDGQPLLPGQVPIQYNIIFTDPRPPQEEALSAEVIDGEAVER